MGAILASGTYVPSYRLDRSAAGLGSGTRAVASFDEDSTSLGVEAARRAMSPERRSEISSLLFTTTAPAYADRTNATAIHQALDLPPSTPAFDMAGSLRSVVASLRAAADAADAGRTSALVAADVRVGLSGSSDERNGGDAGAAMIFGPGGAPSLAEIVSTGSRTAEFVDRWRVPGDVHSRVWEERFGETVYVRLAEEALNEALKRAGLTSSELDHLVVTGLHERAVASVRRRVDVRDEVLVDDLRSEIGVCGAAHPLLLLVDVLERTTPGAVVAVLVLADGADCVLLRSGALAGSPCSRPTVVEQLPGRSVDYQDMLVWRGLLRREPPRRPEPDRPASPPARRNASWKFGFVGSRCTECGTRHLPPERICLNCRTADRMAREPLVDLEGTIATYSIDHLAFSVAPPVVVVVVDFDGGGRLQCELADADPASVAVGHRVQMTFRRIHTTADGIHNYFWKARCIRETS